jgi:predicted negative regulator of RcsB-dependent stress response
VEAYRTEEEQIEQLKSWFRQYGTVLIAAGVIAVAAVFGWRAWEQHRQTQQLEAAASYQNLLEAVRQIDRGESGAAMRTTANTLAETLKQEHEGSGYALLAALMQARLAVEMADLPAAETELRWVLDRDPPVALAALARLRLARVLLAAGDADAALAQLDNPGAYAFAFAHQRGDILRSKGDEAGASAAYEEAQRLGRELQPPFDDPVLALKLHDLRPSPSEAAAGATAESEQCLPISCARALCWRCWRPCFSVVAPCLATMTTNWVRRPSLKLPRSSVSSGSGARASAMARAVSTTALCPQWQAS